MPAMFANPAEFLGAVRAATIRNEIPDNLRMMAADSHNTRKMGSGGFLIPQEWSDQVLSLATSNPVLTQFREIEMTETIVHVLARFSEDRQTTANGGLLVQVDRELETIATSKATFERLTLRSRQHAAVAFATMDVVDSSIPQLVNLLAGSFEEEMGWQLLSFFIEGSGVGEPLGILNSPCLIEVGKEIAQAGDTIVYENVVNMLARIWDPSTAVWLANAECYPQLLNLEDANGNRVWTGDLNSFFGRPIVFTEHCHALGDRGDLILCNPSEYLLGIRRRAQVLSSIHVRFLESEQAFRFWVEIDGCPWWRSPITPKHGESTLSPFVVLESREGE